MGVQVQLGNCVPAAAGPIVATSWPASGDGRASNPVTVNDKSYVFDKAAGAFGPGLTLFADVYNDDPTRFAVWKGSISQSAIGSGSTPGGHNSFTFTITVQRGNWVSGAFVSNGSAPTVYTSTAWTMATTVAANGIAAGDVRVQLDEEWTSDTFGPNWGKLAPGEALRISYSAGGWAGGVVTNQNAAAIRGIVTFTTV